MQLESVVRAGVSECRVTGPCHCDVIAIFAVAIRLIFHLIIFLRSFRERIELCDDGLPQAFGRGIPRRMQ